MSRFKLTRRGFIGSSAAATAFGVAGCAGGTSVGGTSNGLVPNGTSPTPGGSAGTPGGTSATPAATASPSATSGPTTAPTASATSSAAYPGPSISNGSRQPGSLPNPSKPIGTADTTLPFDTIVVVMMENHSFDNYFGMLAKRGQPLADGFTFDANGNPTNKNPAPGGYQHVFHLNSTCQPGDVDQSWASTKKQIGTGGMDGFSTFTNAMGYWDEPDLPFYYSLAKTFCVGNRSFCSATSQTYPNRRYYMAGTSSGNNETSTSQTSSLPYPPAGTIFDSMSSNGVTWANYFTDLPATAIIQQNLTRHPSNILPISNFFTACETGTLPNVSFVDPEFGFASDVGSALYGSVNSTPGIPAALQSVIDSQSGAVTSDSGSEEQPADIAIGEAFVSKVINAAMQSPQWKRMLIIWTYDEHGGYYDHVPPAAAVLPDNIPPILQPGDPPGQFNTSGVRIPTVIASPYSKANAVSNIPHDHTAILATIQAKWNLPALTHRDAQSVTLFDYLDFSSARFANPPALAAPANPALVSNNCAGTPPPEVITPNVIQRNAKVLQPTRR